MCIVCLEATYAMKDFNIILQYNTLHKAKYEMFADVTRTYSKQQRCFTMQESAFEASYMMHFSSLNGFVLFLFA